MRRRVIMIVAMLLTGCMAYGTKVSEDKLLTLEKGRTTYEQALLALGKPNTTTLREDGTRQAVYTYTQTQLRPQGFIPFAGPFLRGQDTEETSVVLEFDSQAVLMSYSATSGQVGLGTGLSSGARQK
jgi:outer membrane protein assembly factor BamE (lipoprotein component of BamABCDE complex)